MYCTEREKFKSTINEKPYAVSQPQEFSSIVFFILFFLLDIIDVTALVHVNGELCGSLCGC